MFICEGEKDATNVAALGFVATTNPGGGVKGSWTPDLNMWFLGRTVFICEDHDETGRKHANEVARALKGIAKEIRIVEFHELVWPEKDVSHWLDHGHTKEELLERAKAGRLPSKGYSIVYASDIKPRNIDWLWPNHLPDNSLELLAGVPGGGKSQIQDGYAACVTTGIAWPDGANGQGRRNVIMMTAEDVLDDTLVPRLIAAGADLDRVIILKNIHKDDKDRMFLLAEDLAELEEIVAEVGDVGLVTIDPITAYMGSGKIDSHRATDVRGQLSPLKDLSERLSICISAITHPAKNAGPSAINQFIGSQAFIAAARFGHLCIAEIEQDTVSGDNRPSGRMLFTQPKHNPVKQQATLAYRIADATGGTDFRTGRAVTTSKIVWEGPVDISADEAQAATAATTKRDHNGVQMFLMNILANGPAPKTIIDERGAVCGFSQDQLKRAKHKMGLRDFKERFQGPSIWCLPQHYPLKETTQSMPNGSPSLP